MELYNAFMNRSVLQEDVDTLHSFIFKCRRNLFPEEQNAIDKSSRDRGADDGDVFALTKLYMHDTGLHAPPLCVLPTESRRRVLHREPPRLLPAKPMDGDRAKELEAAAVFLSDGKYKLLDFHRPAAAAFYRELIGAEARRRIGTSVFLRTHQANNAHIEPTGNQHFPHLPTSGWRLKVKIKQAG